MHRGIFHTILLWFVVCTGLKPVHSIGSFNVNEAEQVLQDSFDCHDNPAFSVAVVKDGQVVLSRGYGVVSREGSHNVTDSTLFQLAGISNSFASTLLVKLLKEKTNLTVDSKVKELLGDSFQLGDQVRTEETTFSDIMAQKLAIPANNILRFDANLGRVNVLDRLALLNTPKQFRVKGYYNYLLYGVVTHLAEVLGGGLIWEALTKQHLLDPLGMTDTGFATEIDFSRKDVAVPYEKDFDGNEFKVSPTYLRLWADLAGSGAVMSSARDMAKWMNFHLSGGKDEQGQEVMPSKVLSEVHKSRFYIGTSSSKSVRVPQFPVTSVEDVFTFGFKRGYYRGYTRLTYSGTIPGYRSMISLLPDQNVGVFTVVTGRDEDYSLRQSLNMYLMDKALGLDSWLNASTICSYPAPWKKPKKPFSPPNLDPSVALKRDVSEYVGTYHNPAYGDLEIVYNNTLSTLVMNYGWGQWQLFTQYTDSKDKFFANGIGITNVYSLFKPIYFLANPKNNSEIVQIKATGFESAAPPIFTKVPSVQPDRRRLKVTHSEPVHSDNDDDDDTNDYYDDLWKFCKQDCDDNDEHFDPYLCDECMASDF